jgi:hypothetical protein
VSGSIEETLNLFPEVKWDRWAGCPEAIISVFGWIARDDGKHDFLLLWMYEGQAVGMYTSSASYSKEFAARLGMQEHNDYKRVEDGFPGVQFKAQL